MLPMALLVTLNPDSLEIWYKPLKGGDWAVCFFNNRARPIRAGLLKSLAVPRGYLMRIIFRKLSRFEPSLRR